METRSVKGYSKKAAPFTEDTIQNARWAGLCSGGERPREMLESGDCRNIMERFSKRFSDHLVETVVNTLEMKRKQLLTMKHELIRSECYMKKLEKDYAEMKQRYCDLKNSTTFLSDLKNMKELLEKNKHGKRAKPVYGLTSLPALLLEAEGIMGAETKLHNINKKLEKSIILDSCAK
ncbi:CENPU protein, partial [Polypterus senegalus]